MTEKEYNDCVSLFADNVYRFILKNLGNKEDSKDVVQTAFEKLWMNRAQVDNSRSKSFLFTVAYNQMIDHALGLGASAVIGVRFDAAEVGANATEVLCYGTAVNVKPEST